MRIRHVQVEGLGHLSTLIVDDDAGVGAVVDPRRDIDVYLEAAREADVRISHVVETHLHNDYVSGGRELAALSGATHVIGVGAELAYEHRGVRNGDTFDVGALRFAVLDTPGHTPEHVAYAVADRSRADDPALLFTGGSLLVGAVGRTDLLGVEQAMPFAQSQFATIRQVILGHDDFVGVYPTHGAGSLCSTGIGAMPSSTIGYERRHNPMVQATDFDAFAHTLLQGQPAFPSYFARMRPVNQAGPRLLGSRVPDPRPLTVDEVRGALARGGLVVDLRSAAAHAVAHVPGSLSIPAGGSFGTWLGWIVDPDRPLVLVLERPDDWDDAVRQALRIGYEQVLGHLRGGVRAWVEQGGAVESGDQISVDELASRLRAAAADRPIVVDVRQPGEFEDGHLPGALHIGCGDLPARLADLPRDRPIVTMCASGYRSSVAASLLRRSGFTDVASVAEGVPAWRARGYPTETGGDAAPVGAASPAPVGHAARHHHDAA